MNDILKRYPMDTKCGLCGKRASHHNAITACCPYGRRDRIGGHSFSSTQSFSPKLPRLRKELKQAVALLVNTLNENHRVAREVEDDKGFSKDEREDLARSMIKDMDFAYWTLFNAILEQNNGTSKSHANTKLTL